VDLPLTSVSGHKYYLAILDDYSHFLWTFPLPLKSDTLSTLTTFFAYVRTQFGITIQGIRCDNGREFDNVRVRTFFSSHGIHLRMSCPYTSAQNGKAERIIRSINNVVRSLLFHASVPPVFWAAALGTATYLINILPTKTLNHSMPHFYLFGKHPSYEHLRVFGCTCYPNLSATAPPTNFPPLHPLCFPRVFPSPQGLPLSRSSNQSHNHLTPHGL
jgi:transposase InsO family protein